MGGSYAEAPFPELSFADFGTTSQYQVILHNSGRTVAIGDSTDAAFQNVHKMMIKPGADAVDVVVHGLPGRFIEKLGGSREIPVSLLAELLEAHGIQRGVALRLLTCHAAEPPMSGGTTAQRLATEWAGSVSGPNGLLRIGAGQMRVDLVDWTSDPAAGMQIDRNTIRVGRGVFLAHVP